MDDEDRTYDTGGFLDGLGLRPEGLKEPRSKEELQRAHDLISPFLLKEIPILLPEEYLFPLHISLDVICWTLRHEHASNKGDGFERNLLELEELVSAAGLVAVEAPPPDPEIEAARQAVGNLFGVGVKGTSIVFLRQVPREISRSDALILAAWLVAIAEEKPGDFDQIHARVMET